MLSIFCDGSSNGRSGAPGGYGWIIVIDGNILACGYGYELETTNNRMEMMGAIRGIEAARDLQPIASLLNFIETFEIVSDSNYTLGIAIGSYNPVSNLDLTGQLRDLYVAHVSQARWVKGHSREDGLDAWCNDVVDKLAKLGKAEGVRVKNNLNKC